MAESQSTAGLVYASAVAADAFARSLLQAHGVPPEDAAIIAGCLVSADLRGVDTHGLCRLPIYLERVRAGLINPKPNLAPKRVTPVAASLDGENGFGFVVGTARHAGGDRHGARVRHRRRVGAAPTHFGMAASYAIPAVEAGLMAMVFSNASQAMPPWGQSRCCSAPIRSAWRRPPASTRRSSSTCRPRSPRAAKSARPSAAARHSARLRAGRAGHARPPIRRRRSPAAWCCRSASTRAPASRCSWTFSAA